MSSATEIRELVEKTMREKFPAAFAGNGS